MMPKTHRGIIDRISMHYVKKARGPIKAICQIEPFQWQDADTAALLNSKLYDQSGELVALAEINWRLGLKNRSA